MHRSFDPSIAALADMERELNPVERMLSIFYVCNICVLERRPTDPLIERERLLIAARKLTEKHPGLRRVLTANPSGLKMKFVDGSPEGPMNVDNHVVLEELSAEDEVGGELREEGDWLDRFHMEIHRQGALEHGRHQWKVIVLAGQRLTLSFFYFGHAIGDGFSGFVGNHDLMVLYSSLCDDPSGRSADEFASDVMLPSPCLRGALAEDAGSSPLSPRGALTSAGTFVAKRGLLPYLYDLAPRLLPHVAPLRSESALRKREQFGSVDHRSLQRTLVRHGAPGGLQTLNIACKKHQCTVGGFVFASMQFFTAVVDSIYKGRLDGTFYGNLNYDINWRARCPTPIGHRIGMMVGFDFVSATIPRQNSTFWKLAKLQGDMMKKKLARGSLSESGLGFEVTCALLDDPAVQKVIPEIDLNLSNIGRWPFQTSEFLGLGALQETFTGQSARLGAQTTDMVLYTMCVGDRMSYSTSFRPTTLGGGDRPSDAYASVILEAVRDMCEGKVFDLAAEEDFSYARFFEHFEGKVRDTYPPI